MFKFIKSLILGESKKTPDGTYVAVNLSEDSKTRLFAAVEKMGVPNPLDKDQYHTTLIYSRKYLPDFKARGDLDPPIVCTVVNMEIFGGTDGKGKALVVELHCPALVDRHNSIMQEHGATYDFDEYRPHITISYNCGDFDLTQFNILNFIESPFIEFVEEYSNDLDLNWADKK